MDYKQKWSLKPNCHSNVNISLASLQNLFPSGVVVWAPANASTDMESTTTEGAPVAEGLLEEANAIGNSGKNDRDRNTLHTGNSLRVHSSRRSIPGKIWVPTNQIRAFSLRAHVYRELLARAPQASRGI